MKKSILLFCLLTLVSCNELKEGLIVDKEYEPARSYMMLMPITTGGKYPTTVMGHIGFTMGRILFFT